MPCTSQIIHVVMPGDNLYKIADHYGTNVAEIISMNPNINPYNLKLGSSIIICNDRKGNINYLQDSWERLNLRNQMRLAWEQHVYWTRMFLISIAERLQDQGDVENRLLKSPGDISKIFENYYGKEEAEKISNLLKEHLGIGAQLITALKDEKNSEAKDLDSKWYANADKMADAFFSMNPKHYNREDLKNMFYKHLDLTKEEVANRLAKNYPADIVAFDKVEKEALSMADYFAGGIMKQFRQKFM